MAPTVEYCEKPIEWIIARPGYFISNIPYLFVGVLLIRRKGISRLFGLAVIFIGLASMFYDASYTRIAQIVDLNAMFVFINLLFILNISSIKKTISTKTIIPIFLLSQLLYLVLILIFEKSGSLIFGLGAVAVVVSEFIKWRVYPKIVRRYWILAFGIFILGWAFWQVDARGIWCNDSNLLNGRAIFHYLTSYSIYFLYLHYERNLKTASQAKPLSKLLKRDDYESVSSSIGTFHSS